MTSLMERLVGEGTGQAIEYKEKLLHNTPAIAQTAIMSMAKKIEDNILRMMTAPIIAP